MSSFTGQKVAIMLSAFAHSKQLYHASCDNAYPAAQKAQARLGKKSYRCFTCSAFISAGVISKADCVFCHDINVKIIPTFKQAL